MEEYSDYSDDDTFSDSENDESLEEIEKTDVNKFKDIIKYDFPKKVDHKFKLLGDNVAQIMIVGQSRSGKSTLLLQIINMICDCKFTAIVSNLKTDVHKAIENHYSKFKDKYFLHISDPNVFCEVLDCFLKTKDENETGLLIFDDFSNYSASRTEIKNNIVLKSFGMLGNYGMNCINILQSPTLIPTSIRNNCSTKVYFKLSDTYAIRSVFYDMQACFGQSFTKEIFKKIWNKLLSINYAFLVLYNSINPLLCWRFNIPLFTKGKLVKDVNQLS